MNPGKPSDVSSGFRLCPSWRFTVLSFEVVHGWAAPRGSVRIKSTAVLQRQTHPLGLYQKALPQASYHARPITKIYYRMAWPIATCSTQLLDLLSCLLCCDVGVLMPRASKSWLQHQQLQLTPSQYALVIWQENIHNNADVHIQVPGQSAEYRS